MTRTLLIGATGQLGRELARLLAGSSLTAVSHAELEITDAAATDALLATVRPDVILNTSAFHAVDRCEDEPERAFAVNALAVRHLARRAAERDSLLVHFSTDYVFAGDATRPYREDDAVLPRSAYATSKLAGECFVRALAPRHLVVRSAGLFGGDGSVGKGGNFVATILRRARAGEPLRVVADQVTAPTYTRDLAVTVAALIERAAADAAVATGVVHATAAGQCSWYEFASAIVAAAGLDVRVEAIPTAALGARAPRPAYSVLENARLAALGIPRPAPWRDGLRRHLAERGELAPPR
ncbi:MAG: dTDP-4-dehydrorhamnose reductase [Deltaproteobacteria bacterium]|nr:dTDP-4-dehydrorhamnose reductase [Deltaproteobacteria bacterium]